MWKKTPHLSPLGTCSSTNSLKKNIKKQNQLIKVVAANIFFSFSTTHLYYNYQMQKDNATQGSGTKSLKKCKLNKIKWWDKT